MREPVPRGQYRGDRLAAPPPGHPRLYLAGNGGWWLPSIADGLKRERENGCGSTSRRTQFTANRSGPRRAAEQRERVSEISLLCSFHYYRRTPLRNVVSCFPGIDVRVFADSGGFSAATLGEAVRLADYARWLRANAAELAQYANLDVIGDAATTARNQRVLESEGLEPIPVFHVGSDFRHLDEILERYDRVCLGGMVPHIKGERGKLAAWISSCFLRMKRPTRVHGFGLGTSWALCKSFPWHSLDSSSWTSAFQYRQVDVFDEARGAFESVSLSTAGGKSVWKHAALLRRYGFSPTDFYPAERFTYLKAGALSVMSVLRAERWLREHPP